MLRFRCISIRSTLESILFGFWIQLLGPPSVVAMAVVSTARRFCRVLKSYSVFIYSDPFRRAEASDTSFQWRNYSSFYYRTSRFSGVVEEGYCLRMERHCAMHMLECAASFSTETSPVDFSPSVPVAELHDKILESVVVKRTMPPNAWLWSLIERCENHNDIKVLFNILQNLQKFRFSDLRIYSNFDCNLCQEVAKACARAGSLKFGIKALQKHNVYGLTPTIGSAHHLLLYAKDHNDDKLMVEIMKLVARSNLPLHPATADIVLKICISTDNWQLVSKYTEKFIKAGINLRRTTFDALMKFAAKIGDTDLLWSVEKLRSEKMKQHTLTSGFSCVRGFLLEGKPKEAAAIIVVMNQTLSDKKKSGLVLEIQKLVTEWPMEVINSRKVEDREVLTQLHSKISGNCFDNLATSLQSDIHAMRTVLVNIGFDVHEHG